MHVSSTLCLHRPDLPITKESLLVHSNPSMSDIRSMVHEGSSFLDMHDIKWDENNLPTPETYLCGSMEHSNNICPGLSTWRLMIMMSPFSWVLKAIRTLDQCRPQSSSEATACPVGRLLDERRKSADGTIPTEKQQHTFRRQLSLRRHRWHWLIGGKMEDLHPQAAGISPELLLLYGVTCKVLKTIYPQCQEPNLGGSITHNS